MELTLRLQKISPGSAVFPRNVQTQRPQSLAKESRTFIQGAEGSVSLIHLCCCAESARFTCDGELLGGHEELVLAGCEQRSVPVFVSYLQPLTLNLYSLRSCTDTFWIFN